MSGRHRAPEPVPGQGRHRSGDRAHRQIWDDWFGQLGGAHRREMSTKLGWAAPPILVTGAMAAVLALNVATTAPDGSRPHGAPGGGQAILWPGSGHYSGTAGAFRQVASVTDPSSTQPGPSGGNPDDGSSAPDGVAPTGGAPEEPTVPSSEPSPGAGDGHTMDPGSQTGSGQDDTPQPAPSADTPGGADDTPPVTLPDPVTTTPDPTPSASASAPAGTGSTGHHKKHHYATAGPTLPSLPLPTSSASVCLP